MVSWKLESVKSRTLDPRARPRSVGSNFILKSKYQTNRHKQRSASNPFSLISRTLKIGRRTRHYSSRSVFWMDLKMYNLPCMKMEWAHWLHWTELANQSAVTQQNMPLSHVKEDPIQKKKLTGRTNIFVLQPWQEFSWRYTNISTETDSWLMAYESFV